MKLDALQTEKLVALISEIAAHPDNGEFRSIIRAVFVNEPGEGKVNERNELAELTEGLRRTKFFLHSVDRKIWLEALAYYKDIVDQSLKFELLCDYKEMRIADANNEIIEFTRRLVMQLENCLNYICKCTNAWESIKEQPNKFKDERNDLSQGQFSFFNSDSAQKRLKDISLPLKLYYARCFYGLNYSFSDINEMITIRNKSSHRGDLSEHEAAILEAAQKSPLEKKSSYFKTFDSIRKKLSHLYMPINT